jgi:hypothetical protein
MKTRLVTTTDVRKLDGKVSDAIADARDPDEVHFRTHGIPQTSFAAPYSVYSALLVWREEP